MRIFVGCSSKNDISEKYKDIARKLVSKMVERSDELVFGGSSEGLMGIVYSEMKKNDKKIIIDIAKAYKYALQGLKYDEVYVLDTVNETKDMFIKHSEAFIFLPGGIGTIDEILTIIEARRNGEHNKPIIIINCFDFFDDLLKMLEKIYDEKFADYENKNCYYIANSVDEAFEYLENIKK